MADHMRVDHAPPSIGRRLRQAAALGGWLAQLANQDQRSLGNSDLSSSVRPGFVLFWIFVFGLGALAGPINMLLWFLGQTKAPPLTLDLAMTVVLLEAFCGPITLLLIVGWLVRFVPFDPDRDQMVRLVIPPTVGSMTVAHATGVFAVNIRATGGRTRYRDRQASIEFVSDAELRVRVKYYNFAALEKPGVTTGYAALVPANTSRVRRGTAHLVSETRPAIELHWLYGPILLDFDDLEARDRVFAALARWQPIA